VPLFDKETDAEILVKALAADTEVLDPEVADTEVMDAELANAVVELFVPGTALNAVPIPDKEDAAFLDKEAEDLDAMIGRHVTGTLSTLKLSSLSPWQAGGC
jgi:hypothetical protein